MTNRRSEALKEREAREANESIRDGRDLFVRTVLANARRFASPGDQELDGEAVAAAFDNWSTSNY